MASDAPELNDSQWLSIEDALHRFEEAWHSESRPDIDAFVAPLDDIVRETALVECIKVDIEYHWRTMQPVFLEAYLERWPDLSRRPASLLELLEAECSTRSLFSMPLDPDELHRRFGDLAEQIDLDEIDKQAEKDRIFPGDDESIRGPDESTVKATPREGVPPVYLPLTMGQSFGRYKIRGQLGEGGEGNVYRAYDRQMDREVALKFPRYADEKVFQRFLHQSKVAAKLEHRNICRVYDAGTVGGVNFIAMALIRGVTIQEKLDESGPFDVAQAATIVRVVAAALGCVHDAAIIHRDIKSANIMIDPDGEPILMDFGLARSTENSVGMTTTGVFAGTLAFMSPEVAGGESADCRSDIYSLGVVLYQMLTGTVPFGTLPAELLRHLGKSPAPSPRSLRPEVSPELDSICRRAMSPRREDRYPSADELADALQRQEEGRPQKYKPPRKPLPRWLWLAAAGLLAVSVAGWTVFMLSRTKPVPLASGPAVDDKSASSPLIGTTSDSAPIARMVYRQIGRPYENGPGAFTVTHDGRRVFLASSKLDDDTCIVRELDFVTGDELSKPVEIQSFRGGYGLAISRDDKDLYVCALYGNDLAHIDLRAERRVTMIPLVDKQKIRDDSDWWRWGQRIVLSPDGKTIVVPIGSDKRPDLDETARSSRNPRIARRILTPNDQLSIIDIASDKPGVLKEIPLDDEPTNTGFSMSKDGQFVYLTTTPRPRSDIPKLYEVQLVTPHRIRTLAFPGAKLSGVSLSHKLQKLYVCDEAGGPNHRKIWVIDRRTFGEVPPKAAFDLQNRAPSEVAVDEQHDLLAVGSCASKSLHLLDAVDGRMLASVNNLPHLVMLCFGPKKNSILVGKMFPAGVQAVSLPVWKHRIVFSSDRGGGTNQLYTVDSDGTHLQPVFPNQTMNQDGVPCWSPDGKWIAFVSDGDTKERICLTRWGDPDFDVRWFKKTEPLVANLAWSPDGKQILYIDSDAKHLKLLEVATGTVKPLNVTFPGKYREIDYISWGGDGCVYATAFPIRDGTRSEVFRIDPNGGMAVQLTDESDKRSSFREVDASRDGRLAVFHHAMGEGPAEAVYWLHVERPMDKTRDLITRTTPPIDGFWELSWFPDDSKIALAAPSDDRFHSHIYSYDLKTGQMQSVTAGPHWDASPDVSGRVLALPDQPVAATPPSALNATPPMPASAPAVANGS